MSAGGTDRIERVDGDHTWEGGDKTHLNCTAVRPWSVFKFREREKKRVGHCPNCGRSLHTDTSQDGSE